MALRDTRAGRALVPTILVAAVALYATYQINFLMDPWSSWAHVESAHGDAVLKDVLATHQWASYANAIFVGGGIDDNPARLRFVSNAVELFDSYSRKEMVAIFGFLPSLANVSSVIYFLLCPVVAFLIASRLIGTSLVGAVAIVLSLGVLLTSVGYVSASIFIFHPAKKIVIAGTLIEFLIFVRYMHTDHTRYVILIGMIQFLLALTDEVGLVSGLSLSLFVAIYVIAFRRRSASDLVWLAGFGVATLLAFAYRYWSHWDAVANQNLPELHSTFGQSLLSVWPAGGFGSIFAHLAGAFSVPYGLPATRLLLLFGLTVAGVIALGGVLVEMRARILRDRGTDAKSRNYAEDGFLFLAALVLLAFNATAAVLLLRFGGAAFLSEYNYYYASVLPVFAFLVACTAFRLATCAMRERSLFLRLTAGSAQVSLALALGLAIAANIENMPRVNRLVGMIHNNPYGYGAINEAGREISRVMSSSSAPERVTVRLRHCDVAMMTRQFQGLLDQLGVAEGEPRQAFMVFPSHPYLDEKVLREFIAMMLRDPPPFDIIPTAGGDC
jgi:hypothetical protein